MTNNQLAPQGEEPVAQQSFRLCAAKTPLGLLHIVVDESETVHLAFWEEQEPAARRHWYRWYGATPWPPQAGFAKITQLVESYFSTPPRPLDGLSVRLRGTTFQQKVWAALRAVPFGHAVRYGELAQRVSTRVAARAVGAALRQNPVTLIVPCHRVIAADGSIGGYAGGVHRKLWLLDYESRAVPQPRG